MPTAPTRARAAAAGWGGRPTDHLGPSCACRRGGGDWMVVESGEPDGSFLRLPAVIAIVTNVDPEHLDHYGTFDALRDAFVRFVENIPFHGFAVLCADHPEVEALIPRVADRRIITYGLGVNGDVRALNLKLERSGADFAAQV